ncbi:hypothetical protein KP509_11G087900 [Ceratopteris richardii]|uniref:Uncharacterized protein n=1 Tax=Ceratopteris richardii TaxID=49495 RepID=A0A8T2TTL4_CERRI|nr:hypothetical protein KP509_11G087900 [Ceratopteris richardii]
MVSVHCNFEQIGIWTPNIQNGIHFECLYESYFQCLKTMTKLISLLTVLKVPCWHQLVFARNKTAMNMNSFVKDLKVETRHGRILRMRKLACGFPPFMNHNLHDDLHDELRNKNFVGNRTGRGDSHFLQIGRPLLLEEKPKERHGFSPREILNGAKSRCLSWPLKYCLPIRIK